MTPITEYFVCSDGKNHGYRDTYAEAQALAKEYTGAKIYAAVWGESGTPGLLQRF